MRTDLPHYGLTPLGGNADGLLLDGTHVVPISRLPRSAAASPGPATAPCSPSTLAAVERTEDANVRHGGALPSPAEVEFARRAMSDAPVLAGLAEDVRANIAGIEDWRAAREATTARTLRNVYRG